MARIVITSLYKETLFGAIDEGGVEFIATNRKGVVVGVKKLRGILNHGTHAIDIGGKTATQVVAVTDSTMTVCEWKRV